MAKVTKLKGVITERVSVTQGDTIIVADNTVFEQPANLSIEGLLHIGKNVTFKKATNITSFWSKKGTIIEEGCKFFGETIFNVDGPECRLDVHPSTEFHDMLLTYHVSKMLLDSLINLDPNTPGQHLMRMNPNNSNQLYIDTSKPWCTKADHIADDIHCFIVKDREGVSHIVYNDYMRKAEVTTFDTYLEHEIIPAPVKKFIQRAIIKSERAA